MTTIAITMAGRGQRFRDAGYDKPKYAIEVHGRTLFAWALASLDTWLQDAPHVVFLCRAEDEATAFIAREGAKLGITSSEVIELDRTTDGQATTALRAGPAIDDPGAPFLVYNIDTHVRPGAMRAQDAEGDGWIPCFPGQGSGWSFAAVGPDGEVTDVREKQRVSPHATVGLYWFSSFARYAAVYTSHYGTAGGTNAAGERYIAPMYNSLIASGASVRIALLASGDVVPLGTPAEVDAFAAAPPPASG